MYLILLLWNFTGFSQSAVQQFTANYTSSASTVSSYSSQPANPGSFSSCYGETYTYNWNVNTENQLKLTSFTANSKTFIVSGVTGVEVHIKRVNNANATGDRSIVYAETSSATASTCVTPRILNFKVPYNDNMGSYLNNNVLNQGTDNIFTNTGNGQGNNNNIERVDVVFPQGISTAVTTDVGFILCERGVNYAHDGFRIVAIKSIDASKEPTAFGEVKTCKAGNGSNNGSWGHPSIANGNHLFAAYVLRKEENEEYLKVSSNVTQEIGGVYFSLEDLGINKHEIIYGYSLFGHDGIADPTSEQLLDISNTSVYPTNTNEANGGGLDLIAVNTFFGTGDALASTYFKHFSGKPEGNEVIINWTISDISTISALQIERSNDGNQYEKLATISQHQYEAGNFVDKPGEGIFYYRLKLINTATSVFVSATIQIKVQGEEVFAFVYPTIIKAGGSVTIQAKNPGKYLIQFLNASGSSIGSNTLQYIENNKMLPLPSQIWKPGFYFITIFKDKSSFKKTFRLIIQP